MSGKHLFYGKEIVRDREAEIIEAVLKKFRNEPANEETKEKIYNALCEELVKENISIPFKVILKKDRSKNYRDRIEIILDTRV